MTMNSETPPPLPGWWDLFTAVNPSGPRWPGALRAAVSIALPAAVALMAGYDSAMLMIAGGGFAVIYGEGLPFRRRWRIMATAGVLLVAGAVAGAFVGSVVWAFNAEEDHWWLLLIALFTTVIAGIAGFVQNALRLPPPGTFFLVMLAGGSTMLAKQGWNPVEVGLWTGIGASFAVIVGMLPGVLPSVRRRPETAAVERLEARVGEHLESLKGLDGLNGPHGDTPTVAATHQVKSMLAEAWDKLADAGLVTGGERIDASSPELAQRCLAAHRRLAGGTTDTVSGFVPLLRPSIRYRLFRSMTTDSHATVTAVKIMVAALLAGVIGIALGLDRPDWAIVTAMVILQWGPDRRPGTVRGIHRLVGSVLGVLLFAGFHLLELQGFGLLAALAVCQFFAEVFVVRNYAFTVIAVTPLAMMMGGAIHQPLGPGVEARMAEVAIATACALAALWFVLKGADVRRAKRQVDNCVSSMAALLGRLMVTASPQDALVQRRDVQYELLRERRDAQAAANNHRGLALRDDAWWQRHLAVQHTGYELLDRCAVAGARPLGRDELDQMAGDIRSL